MREDQNWFFIIHIEITRVCIV